MFPEIQRLEARIQETDTSEGCVKRQPVTFTLETAPQKVPCHGSDCTALGGLSLVRLIKGMVQKGETRRWGFAPCDGPSRQTRGACINYFEYFITIQYAREDASLPKPARSAS
ncbi:MAG: hypothetical protein ACUVUC_13860 [Thermoguttaceae bacterium]